MKQEKTAEFLEGLRLQEKSRLSYRKDPFGIKGLFPEDPGSDCQPPGGLGDSDSCTGPGPSSQHENSWDGMLASWPHAFDQFCLALSPLPGIDLQVFINKSCRSTA